MAHHGAAQGDKRAQRPPTRPLGQRRPTIGHSPTRYKQATLAGRVRRRTIAPGGKGAAVLPALRLRRSPIDGGARLNASPCRSCSRPRLDTKAPGDSPMTDPHSRSPKRPLDRALQRKWREGGGHCRPLSTCAGRHGIYGLPRSLGSAALAGLARFPASSPIRATSSINSFSVGHASRSRRVPAHRASTFVGAVDRANGRKGSAHSRWRRLPPSSCEGSAALGCSVSARPHYRPAGPAILNFVGGGGRGGPALLRPISRLLVLPTTAGAPRAGRIMIR